MLVLLLIIAAFLVSAVTVQLVALAYPPETLLVLFLSLPLPQQIAWAIICLVPVGLLAVAAERLPEWLTA